MSADGSTAIIGAREDEDPNGPFAGSAYVFSNAADGWHQTAKLTADDGDDRDRFGHAVAVADDGSTAIIGAPQDEDPHGEKGGSAYVFSRENTEWEQETKLTATEGNPDDHFGDAVAVSGDGTTTIIGSLAESAYVFSKTDGSWTQEDILTAPDGATGFRFGSSVAIANNGSIAIIGSSGDGEPNGRGGGSAHVFSQEANSWTHKAKLAAEAGDVMDFFGHSVAISDNGVIAVIGAIGDRDPNGQNAGSTYVFSSAGGSWTQEARFVPDDGDDSDRFGFSVAVTGDGSTAVIGARNDEDPNGENAGSAYVFEKGEDSWAQKTKLTASDGDTDDFFGHSVTITKDGTTAIIGAFWEENPNRDAGSAYVYTL